MVIMLDCEGGGSIIALEGVADGQSSSRPGLESTGMHQSERAGQRFEATLGENRVAEIANHLERGETRRGGR